MNRRTAFALLLLAATTAACRTAPANDPILKLSTEESLVTGKELLAQKKYAKARPYLTHAFEIEPNSAQGREALLLAADTYYLEGGNTNYIQSEAKYRDYLNRFPTSVQASYAQFQIANSLAARTERPDRDQSVTRRALEAYQDLIRLFPTSEHVEGARQKMIEVRAQLAEHEFVVGRFYLRYGIPAAAVGRFELLLSEYPDYPHKDKVIYHLGLAYAKDQKGEESQKAFERLRNEFPQSPWIREVPSLPASQKTSA